MVIGNCIESPSMALILVIWSEQKVLPPRRVATNSFIFITKKRRANFYAPLTDPAGHNEFRYISKFMRERDIDHFLMDEDFAGLVRGYKAIKDRNSL